MGYSMSHTSTFTSLIILFSLPLWLTACGGSDNNNDVDSEEQTFTYSTTSSKGDYSEWTLTGSSLSAIWNFIATDGAIEYTFTVSATCSAADSTGSRECTINTSSCADGSLVCPAPPAGSFSLMEAPGVALYVITNAGMIDAQLHVGFAKNDDACSEDVSGDYTFLRTGLGLRDIFGLYRSDANFINILHADFGVTTSDSNASQMLSYNTGSEAETLGDNGCSNGIRERTIGGITVRSMITNSGLFLLDLPAGEGGLIAFETSRAATLSDFANKNFGGISFPDNGPAETFSAVSGPLLADQVDIATTFSSGDVNNLDIKTLATVASLTTPAYPDFTISPTGYNASTLFASYPTASSISGVFKLDQLGDTGRVIMVAMKFSDKIIAMGMVYNYRTITDIDPSAGDGVTTFSENGLYNTGNFILFEQ